MRRRYEDLLQLNLFICRIHAQNTYRIQRITFESATIWTLKQLSNHLPTFKRSYTNESHQKTKKKSKPHIRRESNVRSHDFQIDPSNAERIGQQDDGCTREQRHTVQDTETSSAARRFWRKVGNLNTFSFNTTVDRRYITGGRFNDLNTKCDHKSYQRTARLPVDA